MANANWEHAHVYMDDAGTVVASSDLSSQVVDLTAGGGGSQSPSKFAQMSLAPTTLTAGSDYYQYQESDLTITQQVGGIFSIDTAQGGAVIRSSEAGTFYSTVYVGANQQGDATLDPGSDIVRYLQFFLQMGDNATFPWAWLSNLGIDSFVPIMPNANVASNYLGQLGISVPGVQDAGEIVMNNIAVALCNHAAGDSIPVNSVVKLTIWKA